MTARFNPYAAFWEMAAAGSAASMTIALRMNRAYTAALKGELADDPENARMVLEKVAAASEGWSAATRYWMRHAGAGLALDPAKAAALAPGAALAFSRPAYRKAKANAKRLSRKRKTG